MDDHRPAAGDCGLPTSRLGWVAGSAFAAALVTQLSLARYADRGYATLDSQARGEPRRGRPTG